MTILNTRGLDVLGGFDFFESHDVIRHSAARPWAGVELSVGGYSNYGLLDLSEELGSRAVTLHLRTGYIEGRILTGSGNDRFTIDTNPGGAVTLDGGAGTDVLVAGLGGISRHVVTTRIETLLIDESNEGLSATAAQLEAFETIRGTAAGQPLRLVLSYGSLLDLSGEVGTRPVWLAVWTGLDVQVTAGAGADRLTGWSGDDTLVGGRGNDTLQGDPETQFGSDDVLRGGSGDDTLHGGAGHDSLFGGAGRDLLLEDRLGNYNDDTSRGGTGADTFHFAEGHDRILDFANDVDRIVLGADVLPWNVTRSAEEIFARAQNGDGFVRFVFETGTLTVSGVSHWKSLVDDLSWIP